MLIAVAPGNWQENEVARFRQEVVSFYQAVNRTNPIRLALLAGENSRSVGPFKSRAELQAALRDLITVAATE